MHIVLWSLLVLFILSMTVGGLVGGANIIDRIFGKVNPSEAIGMVNGEKISPDQFSQLVSSQLDEYRTSGREVTDRDLARIRGQVWDDLVNEMLIRQAVEDLGIEATDEEVLYHLENNPPDFLRQNQAFQTNGSFDPEKYQQAIANPQGNEWLPVEQFMKNSYIPNFKLQQLILNSVTVTEEEIRQEFIQQTVPYTIQAIHVTERAVDMDAIQPTEEDLREAYRKRIDEFSDPEKRVVSFVVWKKIPTKADTLRIRDEALDLKRRAEQGEDFAYLANTYTDDPGNQVTPDSARDGKLGWFGRGQMVPPFEEAAFAAEPGDVVGPVETRFGYHIIKVIDKRTTNDQEQVHAAHILLQIESSSMTIDELNNESSLFSYDAREFGFEAVADSYQVNVVQSRPFTQEAVFVPGLGALRSAVRFAFNSEIATISDVYENENLYAVVRLDSIIKPGPRSFAEVKSILEREILQKRAKDETLLIATDLKNRLQTGEDMETLAKEDAGIDYIPKETKPLSQSFTSIARSNYVVGALLYADKGDLAGPVQTNRGHTLIRVLDIGKFDDEEFEVQINVLKQRLLSTKQGQVYNGWLEARRDEAEIIDNRKYYF